MHLSTTFGCLLAAVPVIQSHFILTYPGSLGFDDDTEAQSPCGGSAISFNDTNPTIQGNSFPVAVMSTHPAANWLYRATLSKEAPFNWTNLLPVVDETGLGNFCLQELSAPAEFIGQSGLLQVIQQGPDGMLYQVWRSRTVSTINPRLMIVTVCRSQVREWFHNRESARVQKRYRPHCFHHE